MASGDAAPLAITGKKNKKKETRIGGAEEKRRRPQLLAEQTGGTGANL